MLKNIKAAIFDMDGTIIDSMWVWDTIDKVYLEKIGLKVPGELRNDIKDLSFLETAHYFKNRFNIKDSPEEIMESWNNIAYFHYLNNVKMKPFAKDYLLKIKKLGTKIGLATSNSNLLVETVLKKYDVYNIFDCITTSDEVARGKDFPDIYLLAAKKLQVSPKDCAVFEDILPGILSAKSVGMTTVGVHDFYSDSEKLDIIKNSDMFIENYKNLAV
ncbi:MAG: HAD family phosphatase [Clostridium sp.]|nr:HAD family phosphatase [Clostridium sp.]